MAGGAFLDIFPVESLVFSSGQARLTNDSTLAPLQPGFPSLQPQNIVLGITCLLCGVLALVGLTHKFRYGFWGLTLALPQQFILMESLIGAVIAISTSSFADGVIRPRLFIAADQVPAILAAILHTMAIVNLHINGVFSLWKRKIIDEDYFSQITRQKTNVQSSHEKRAT